MTMDFERKISPKTPRDIQAEGIVASLDERDRQGGSVNIDYLRSIERGVENWSDEGYHYQAFSDRQGFPVVIARHEDEAMFDDGGIVRQDVDVRYRIYLETETREVVVPSEFVKTVAQTIDGGDVLIYDASETNVLELMLREGADAFADDIAWLKEQFGGSSLEIKRPHLSPVRLETDESVIGVAVSNLSLFRESDF
jgi:hypothetical protein